MKKIFSTVGLLMVSLFLLSSCVTDEKDNSGPEIIIENPEEGEVFAPSDLLSLQMVFKDQDGVAVYQYMIYNEDIDATNSFEADREVAIAGFYTEFTAGQSITIPEEVNNVPLASGTYVIEVRAIDQNADLSIVRQNFSIVAE